MKIICCLILYLNVLFAEDTKIYFYSTDININNFKSLKISFDTYIADYGDYKFQPFSDKDTFERQLKNDDSILILSSWHYKELSKKYNLDALLVAQKKGTITDTKVLVGRKNSPQEGLITSAYDISYTKKLLMKLTKNDTKNLPILIVPKEIDALMSVSFGMSDFALVSKDSLYFLEKINPSLTKKFKIFYESEPKYRVLFANNTIMKNNEKIITIFNNMSTKPKGKDILEKMGIEKLVLLSREDKYNLGDIK